MRCAYLEEDIAHQTQMIQVLGWARMQYWKLFVKFAYLEIIEINGGIMQVCIVNNV